MKNIKEVIVLMCCLSLIFPAPIAFAAPQGGKVVGGSANIHQSGTTTTINQSSDRAIINWHSFDIGKNEAVRHNMPSTKSAGLHRVVGGGGASQIQGLLQSNGNIYLVNPAGVVIHKGARVDTNSFIATTRDIADSNFMKGKMVFDRPGRPGAHIINQGAISVKESGLAALVAPTVRNEGVIAGKLGKVALASGDSTWKLDMHGDDLITFTVNENDVNALHAADGTPLAGAGVENSGSIKAEGGVVVLTAAQLDGIVGSVVNSGEVSAASAEVKGGKITFRGQGSDVDIVNTGTVDVSSAVADGGMVRMDTDGKTRSSGTIAATGGQKGGKVTLTGREVALASTSKIDVSGATGGGTALVGGNALGKGSERNAQKATVERGAAIHADAKSKGDGGQVVVWSDEKTTFDGIIIARGGKEGGDGGMVETSGKSLKVGDTARVNTLAPQGKAGQWLLDPVDFVIAASDGDMTGATVSANLEMGDVIIQSDSGSSGTNGDILVNDTISWAADTHLTLDAYRNVNINADITAIGATAGLNILPQNGVFNLAGSKITLSGANPSLSIAGQQYIIINSVQSLQSITDLNGHYALGGDIDATETKTWNKGSGFDPIGNFYGTLNGLGNTISQLYIKRPTTNWVGIFRRTESSSNISNLRLQDFDIHGGYIVGSITGENSGIISNVYTSGTIFTTYALGLDPLTNATGQIIGGIVGKNSGYISYAQSNSNVTGVNRVGGLVGENSGTILFCSSSGDIRAVTGDIGNLSNHDFGGLVGRNSKEIIGSFSNSDVYGVNNVGGIIGSNHSNAVINGSFSTGKVSGTNSIGGFAGIVYADSIIKNSFSEGDVFGTTKVGGFAGSSSGSIQNSYSISHVTGISNAGGFIGSIGETAKTSNCYWDMETSEMPSSVAGQGLSTTQMLRQSSYVDWDFNNIWTIAEGQSYPQFQINLNIPIPNPGTGGGTTDPGTGGGTTDPGTGGGTTDPGTGGGTTEPGTGGGTTDPGTGGGTTDPGTGGGTTEPGTGGGTTDPNNGNSTSNILPEHSSYHMPKWLDNLCEFVGDVTDGISNFINNAFNKEKNEVPEENEEHKDTNIKNLFFHCDLYSEYSINLKKISHKQIDDKINEIKGKLKSNIRKKIANWSGVNGFVSAMFSGWDLGHKGESIGNEIAKIANLAKVSVDTPIFDENISQYIRDNKFNIPFGEMEPVVDGNTRKTTYLTVYPLGNNKYNFAILELTEERSWFGGLIGNDGGWEPVNLALLSGFSCSARNQI